MVWAVVDQILGGPATTAMSIPVEEREHNGDYINRAEKVGCLYKPLHTNMADRAP